MSNSFLKNYFSSGAAGAVALALARFLKQSAQSTLADLGSKGTWPSFPQFEQIMSCISFGPLFAEPAGLPLPPSRSVRRFLRHSGQRVGGLSNPFCAKNSCSPADHVNSAPQSRQVKVLSWYIHPFEITMFGTFIVLVYRSESTPKPLTTSTET